MTKPAKAAQHVSAHHVALSLLCAYQKYFDRCVKDDTSGHALVADMWNTLLVCQSKKDAVRYLKDTCQWELPGHQLLTFMTSIWAYQPSVRHHEAHASAYERLATNV